MEIPTSHSKLIHMDLLRSLRSAPSTSSTTLFDDDPPSSSTGTSCFDFALYDYLHSRHISSSTGTSCFDLALDILAEVNGLRIFPLYDNPISDLQKKVILLKTFFLYIRKCRRRRNGEALLKHDQEDRGKALLEHEQEDRGNIISESLRRNIFCFRIQNVAIRMIHDLGSALLQYKPSLLSALLQDNHFFGSNIDILLSAVTRSEQNIALFLGTDIVKLCTRVFDCYSQGDPQLLMNLIDVIFVTLEFYGEEREILNTIRKKLLLLSNLIGFATMRGVECTQLTDPFTPVACLISLFERRNFSVFREKISEILSLIHKKVNPLDPQILETCIHVLTASKKQSRSAYALALEGNKCPMVVPFIDSLHDHLVDLLGSSASSQVPNEMLKLYQGVRYLKAFAKTEEKLGDEMKDLIVLAVCDAGIMILSLSVNEIKEGLPMPKETDLGLFHLHKVLEYMMAEIPHNYPLKSPYSSFNYPRCNELGCMDFFLENLTQLARCHEADDSIVFLLDKIQMVQKDLEFLRRFLENIKEQRYQNGKLQAFWSHVMEAAYKAELLIDSALVGDKYEDSLDAVARDINLLRIEAPEIHNGQTQRVNKTSIHIKSPLTATIHKKDLVGLDDQVETITHRLTRGSKQLEVVPIVGMAGLGKTTLADEVYNAPSVKSRFHVRGWCCVSQMYSMHSLLAQLLFSISSKSLDEYLKKDENDLALELWQGLLKNRYLLVLDDLWEVEAWNLLKKSLPNDVNGSRILFTSRFQNLSSQFKPDSLPYHLRQLTDEESWTLLQKKLFAKEGCPPELIEVGSQIAKACRGLPLAVVLVSGILATTGQDSWEELAKSLCSSILENDFCMKTLELSYRHLPDYLKPCLLYFGALPEDIVFNVRRLLWLWISEGLVQQTKGKSSEEAAYDYLMALIDRSLVMVTEQRSMSGAKACQLHDLVREFCVKKAKEQGFLHTIHSRKDLFCLAGPRNPHGISVHCTRELKIWELMLFFPNLRCLYFFNIKAEKDLGILFPKLLRVLNLGDLIFYKSFPMEVLLLVHLRFLVLNEVHYIPSAIANLSRLQILIVQYSDDDIVLPNTIWNIKTLSYLRATHGNGGFIFPAGNHGLYPDLDHLDSLGLAIDPSSQSLQELLTKLPGIRRLKCTRPSAGNATGNCNTILVFDCLSRLESLHLRYFAGCGFIFPKNLKKLALYATHQPWSEISAIGKLPRLEVLKLLIGSFVGKEWELKEGEFPKLRVLKLSRLSICNWTAPSANFSCLKKLVMHGCRNLGEVPSCLGECPNLEMIGVKDCRGSVVNSVKQIQQEQMDMGNVDLKIVIEDLYEEMSNSSEEDSIPSEAEEISSERESTSSDEDLGENERTVGFHSSEHISSEGESTSSHHSRQW